MPPLCSGVTLASFHFSGNSDILILWLQIYVTDSAIYGAAIFKRRGPILSHPVAFDTSICFRNFSTVSIEICGIVKNVPSGTLFSQNVFSFSKLEFSMGSFRLDAIETKNLLNVFASIVLEHPPMVLDACVEMSL